MKLQDVILCLDCDEIAPLAEFCPDCTSRTVIALSTWIPPLGKAEPLDVRAARRHRLFAEARRMATRMVEAAREVKPRQDGDAEPLGIGA